MTRKWACAALAALTGLALASCSATTGPLGPDIDGPPIATRTITGTVEFPEGVTFAPSDLTVVSFAGRGEVSEDGAFTLVVPDSDLPQVILAMAEGPSPVLLGYVTESENDVLVDASSTALSLVLLNPFTTMFSASDRATIVTMVESKDWWPELVEWTESVVGRSGAGRLDERLEPALLQLAAELAIDVLNDWPGGGLAATGPWFEDASGGRIVAVNPEPSYCAAVFRGAGGESKTRLLDSDRSGVRVRPAWPPFVDANSKTRTDVNLGDGIFSVTFTRGDFNSLDPATADGLASLWNAGRAVTELLALATGVTRSPDLSTLDLSGSDCSELASRVRASDTIGFVRALLDLMAEESDVVSEWYWQEPDADAAQYVETVCSLLSGIAFSTRVLSPGESRIPFFTHLAQGPPLPSQMIAQEDGVLTESGSDSPPRAAFTVSPQGAQPGALLVFDASPTTDPESAASTIEVRWDWGNDGVWDTAWSTVKVVGHGFADVGPHEVAMQARDRGGLADVAVHTVNIGGSDENATHVIVFRDAVPWANQLPPVLDQMLEAMGFDPGPGAGEYEVAGTAEMDTLALTPGVDLVIIQSDQPQGFYDSYAANQVRFLQFVSQGGTMLWEACDGGWNGGSIEEAGIVLPGAVELTPYETWYNYVRMPGAPIVSGLPSFLYGQYASHAGLTGLPDGAVTYITDDDDGATLVEFSYGIGWVIMTTQPLEWSFYHNWTSGAVMPHVVSYVLGVPLVHDFGDIVKPGARGRPRMDDGAGELTSGMH
ncbi:MAG: PKD domain-containing protein [Candidatus Eisenbacteria bacterium]